MIWRIYYGLLALLGPFALLALRLVVNPLLRNKRVRVVLLHPDGRVLLVVNALGDRKWTLPGGGATRRETLVEAAIRELHEELGIVLLPRTLTHLGEVEVSGYKAPLFAVQLNQLQVEQIIPDKFEIYDTQWCDVHELPSGAQPIIHIALELLSRHGGIAKIESVTLSS